MSEPRTVLRWLAVAAMLQSAVIFLVHVMLTESLSTVRGELTDALYKGQVPVQEVDRVNQAFWSISSLIFWVVLTGIAATCVGYGLIRSLIIKSWLKQNP